MLETKRRVIGQIQKTGRHRTFPALARPLRNSKVASAGTTVGAGNNAPNSAEHTVNAMGGTFALPCLRERIWAHRQRYDPHAKYHRSNHLQPSLAHRLEGV